MPVKLYMDEHVPAAITRALRIRGVDVLTAREDGRNGAEDPALLDRAGELERVLFTRDEDFLIEAARRLKNGEAFVGVIYAHQLRISLGDCIGDLELIAEATDLPEFRNRVEYLPL